VKYFYEEKNLLIVGLISKSKDLQLEDIFSDDSSAIDLFIKSALEHSGAKVVSKENEISINPEKNYQLNEQDIALVLG